MFIVYPPVHACPSAYPICLFICVFPTCRSFCLSCSTCQTFCLVFTLLARPSVCPTCQSLCLPYLPSYLCFPNLPLHLNYPTCLSFCLPCLLVYLFTSICACHIPACPPGPWVCVWVPPTCMEPEMLSLSLRISCRFFVPRMFLRVVWARSLK